MRSTLLAALLLAGLALPGATQNLDELLRAVQQGQLPKVTALLDKNPSLSKATNARGHSALYDAAYMNRPDVANLLVARGADVNQPTKRHTLPLHAAAQRGSLEISTLLVLNGALVDVTDPEGRTPLHLAAYGRHAEIVKLLLSKGSNPKIRDTGGSTALHQAARSGSVAAVEMLLAAGAEIDAKDNRGRTPLFLSQAGKHGDWEKTSALLLQKGAAPLPPKPAAPVKAPEPAKSPSPTPKP